jgi:hypothetical protein
MPRNKGIKQDSDPGISPGIKGIKPVSSPIRLGDSDSTYFQNQINHMINKPSILLLFLSIILFSFRNTDKTTSYRFPNRTYSVNQQEMLVDTGGRAVSLDSAQACIDRFTGLMQAHGFSDLAGQPIDIHLTTTSMMTTGETFDGKKLQKWLNTTADQYKAAHKTLMIKIQLGVYDMNYLNTYQPNAALRNASNNRIAIFLIPYDASTGHAALGLAQPQGGTGGGGGTGYDLGGVQP